MTKSEPNSSKRIYTRRGDGGQTDLFGGERVSKDDLRVATYGTADELNAALGSCGALSSQADLRDCVLGFQRQLFELGAFLATPDTKQRAKGGLLGLGDADIADLETQIDRLDAELPPMRSFILPGGSPAAAAFHTARAICRRLEREMVGLDRGASLGEAPLRYVNRLSDLLFVMARVENARTGVADIPWNSRHSGASGDSRK